MSESCKTELRREALARLVNIAPTRLDLEAVQKKLAAARGKHYWRSLEELAETREFQEMLHREFPRHASEWTDEVSRRNFLKLMSASLALAGLAGCTRQPVEQIVPYIRQPEEIIPGKPLFFASAMPMGGHALPVLVKSDMGRPIKVEGNPEHPAGNLGTDKFAQASLLEMYDPDRSQAVTVLGEMTTWGSFLQALQGPLTSQKSLRGAGIRFLTGRSTSPTLASQMRAVLQAFPDARWHQYEPVNRDNSRAGAQMAFGQDVVAQHRLENADVILSLDANFLSSAENPQFLRNAAEFGKRRKSELKGKINRLYVVESMLTITGAKAEHRLPLRASEIEAFARALLAQVSGGGAGDSRYGNFLPALAKDLSAHRGSSVVIAGETQPPAVHALAHALNDVLGNVGRTVVYTDSVEVAPEGFRGCVESLRDLMNDINAGKVEMLVIADTNPVFTAPVDMNFNESNQQLMKVPLRIHMGIYHDETANICQWHINQAHYLESWSDARTFDGTASIIQPLIDPLYSGRTIHELLAAFTGEPGVTSYDLLRAYWQRQHSADFENFWRRSLHDGFLQNSALPPQTVTLRSRDFPATPHSTAGDYEVVFRPDENIYDGRFGNNGWLQELPQPITKVTWDNPIVMGIKAAQHLGLVSEDMVEIDLHGRKLKMAVWIEAGIPDNSVTLCLGFGRKRGTVAADAGFNTYLLRASDGMCIAQGAKISKIEGHYQLAATHHHHSMYGRALVRTATVKEFDENPHFAKEMVEEPSPSQTLLPAWDYSKGYQWGMAIDIASCIGCNTCVVACQSENNIPVVGKFEVTRGREMHWLRVDRYYTGTYENPKVHFQPVPCMQCENAPCEYVCPVHATTHSTEGLNDMVYNRCVGTRYCSNNCPYKVRRFNFYLYSDYETPVKKLMNNPDVTVRSRGVMEKCTYCVQRINRTRIEAEKANREIQDGEIKTACQQACPADAIVFGNINDKNSRVSRLKGQSTNYPILADLNTRPRTTYLAEVMNTNSELGEPDFRDVPPVPKES